MKKSIRRAFALVMALAMILSFGIVQSFASVHKSSKKYKTYVVIGDSIGSGYGLDGDIDALSTQMTCHHGELVEGSYPALIAKAIGAKKTYNLAREGYSVANFLRILSPEYEEWISQPANWQERWITDFFFMVPKMTDSDDFNNVMENAQTWVKNADVITIQLGSNETGNYAFMAPIIKTLYYAGGLEYEALDTLLNNGLMLPGSFEDLISMIGGYDAYYNELQHGIAEFEKNYDLLIKRIRELNPDCDIYYVGMYNVFKYVEPQDGLVRTALSESGVELADELRDYVTNRSAYKNEIIYVDVPDTTVWPSWPMYTPVYFMQFLVHCHPNRAGHQYMAEQIIKTMNGQEVSMPEFSKGSSGWGVYSEEGTLRNYTGMAKRSNGKCYYVKKGLWQKSYTGVVRYNGKKYYVKKGTWQSSYSGTVRTSKYVYTIKNGYVTKQSKR